MVCVTYADLSDTLIITVQFTLIKSFEYLSIPGIELCYNYLAVDITCTVRALL